MKGSSLITVKPCIHDRGVDGDDPAREMVIIRCDCLRDLLFGRSFDVRALRRQRIRTFERTHLRAFRNVRFGFGMNCVDTDVTDDNKTPFHQGASAGLDVRREGRDAFTSLQVPHLHGPI
jgi:hypothetical protein